MKELYKKQLEQMIGVEDKIEKEIAVGCGVIIKEGENFEKMVLLIQRSEKDHWPLHWECPRGKCDKPIGEDIAHCVKREVKEETGLDVEPLGLIDTFEYIADKGTRKSVSYNIQCKLIDPNQKIKLSKEHRDYKWVTSMGEIELLVNPDQKRTLIKVLNPEIRITDVPEGFTKNNQVKEVRFLTFSDLEKYKEKNRKTGSQKVVEKYLRRIQ